MPKKWNNDLAKTKLEPLNFSKQIALYFFLLCCICCFTLNSIGAPIKIGAYAKKIDSKEIFEALQGAPLHHKYGQVFSVKVMQEVHSKKIYFINSSNYNYHYRFALDYLHFYGDLTRFNDCNYSDNPCRSFVLGTINYYTALDKYTLEFSSTEVLTSANFNLFTAIQDLVFFADKFYLYPSTSLHRQNIEAYNQPLPIITPDEIYGSQRYQPVHQTKAIGRLRFRTIETLKSQPISPTDIVVLKGSPNELDICSGVITVDFQTPLSHISILCQNRNIPLMALRNCWENQTLRALEDSLVELFVGQDDYKIELSNTEEFEKFQKRKQANKREIELKRRLEVTKLVPLYNLNYKAVDFAGGKAANFGELNFILKKDTSKLFELPQCAFAIPFYYYIEHLKRGTTDSLIAQLCTQSWNSVQTDSLLEAIQISILQTPLNFQLYEAIVSIMHENQRTSLRFRSSTNAEDIKGFNGAGLYESVTGSLLSKNKTIERAIKRVWASTWSRRAFHEREYFNINQQTVAMGILVHENFPEEQLNGVALTSNLYREDMGGYTINCQLGEESIVHPKPGILCEQFVLFDEWEFHKNNTVADYISYSSLQPNEPLLSEVELEHLKIALRTIKQHFYYNIPNNKSNGYAKFTLDIEFKLIGPERKLLIKQVRYY